MCIRDRAEQEAGVTIDGHIVLLATGVHDKYFPSKDILFMNPDISPEAVAWLASHRSRTVSYTHRAIPYRADIMIPEPTSPPAMERICVNALRNMTDNVSPRNARLRKRMKIHPTT